MLKSQFEPTSTAARNYEPATTMFVENIFDTVKKAKAAKAAAAKSLADSKLITSYQYSFADMSPLKKKKKRKNTKANGKVKKPATPKKKTSPRKHKIINKKVGEQRKKTTPPKSPRKYTKRATKIPAPTDIDDEEAAFILSSISQRSFDSFYSRLNSCGSTNKITIPLEVSSSVKSFTSSSDPVHNLAYYVMLDHNYWIVQPEVPAEPIVPVAQDIVSKVPLEVIHDPIPIEIPALQARERLQADEKLCKVDETTPIDIKPISECNKIFQSNEIYKVDEIEENNNKLVTPEKIVAQINECQKKDVTAVKKRWLRQATKEMKTPPKKKKKLEIDEINNEVEDQRNVVEVDKKSNEGVKVENLMVADIEVESNESLEEVFEPSVCRNSSEHAAEVKEQIPKEEVFLTLTNVEDDLEKKQVEPLEIKKEEIKPEEKLCNERYEAENLILSKEVEVELKHEEPKEQTNITEEEEEIDEKSWDSVMNFHRLQLKKLMVANLRHSKVQNITSIDHSSVDRTYSFLKARSLSLTPKSCDEFVSKADVNYSRLPSFPGCTMLNFAQHADSSRVSHEYDKHEPYFQKSLSFAPQRSLSKNFFNDHCRSRRFENGLTIPYNSSSYETPPHFYSESYHQKEEISSRTSYSTYRAQKALQVTHIQTPEVVEPAWEKQFGRSLDEFSTQRSLVKKECEEKTLLGGISRVLSKPTLSATVLPKVRTSVSDPRLNPSLVNDTRKDETTIPKKKLSLDQYRKRVSLTSIADSPSIEEPSISTTSVFDPVIAAETATG